MPKLPSNSAPGMIHVCDLAVAVARPLSLGEVGIGERRVVPILGGEVTGPRLQGRILPGGADIQVIKTSNDMHGATDLAARYVIETDDAALIYVENIGLRTGPPLVMEKLRRGEHVDPALVYFRSTPRFETSAPQYRWLMQRMFVCSGHRLPNQVMLSVFELT